MTLDSCFSAAEIENAVAVLAEQLSRDYADGDLVLVGVLKGSFVFLADLVRRMTVPCEVDFIRARSYGRDSRSSGKVEITKGLEAEVAGRPVVIVEDITDTGLTMKAIVEHIQASRPASVRLCALLAREGGEKPDYLGMWVGPGFVVGYGIDFAESYRWLPDIRILRDPDRQAGVNRLPS